MVLETQTGNQVQLGSLGGEAYLSWGSSIQPLQYAVDP